MRKFATISVIFLLVSTCSLFAQPNIWVNEFHYDNTGGDVGEFMEIAVPVGFTDRRRPDVCNGGSASRFSRPATACEMV